MDADSEWIQNMTTMDFHPCDTPRGMMYYNMDILTKEQQRKLNALKIKTIKQNQKYLAVHPEIRACVALITKLVLKQRPRTNIHETIAEYFSKSRVDIESDVHEYLRARKPSMYDMCSHFDMFGKPSDYSWYDSGSSSSGISYTTSSASSQTTLPEYGKESSMLTAEDVDVETLQMEVSGSLLNLGVEYDKIKGVGSDTPIHSISIVTQTPDEEATESEDEYIRPTHVKPEHITINEYLKRLEESYSYVEDEMPGEGYSYTGHIPTVEDYDAGYGRRRQTFEAGQEPVDEIDGPIADYIAGNEVQEEKKDEVAMDFQLEPSLEDIPISVAHLHVERILKTSLDAVARTVKQSKVALEQKDSEMKALMAKRSVRVSITTEDSVKDFNQQMEDEKRHKRKSKDERKSLDDGERRVRTNIDRETRTSLKARDKLRYGKDGEHDDTDNTDQASLASEHHDEEYTEGTDQRHRPRQISIGGRDDKEAGGRKYSIGSQDESPSIEFTIRQQFDPSFKSMSHMKDRDEAPKSRSNIYFTALGEGADDDDDNDTTATPILDNIIAKTKLEQKVSFGEGKPISETDTDENA